MFWTTHHLLTTITLLFREAFLLIVFLFRIQETPKCSLPILSEIRDPNHAISHKYDQGPTRLTL